MTGFTCAPAAFPWARSLPDTDTHLKAFASELREAVVAESPERVGRVLNDWQAVADELAGALRTTMLRNASLPARDWDRASAALARYDTASAPDRETCP